MPDIIRLRTSMETTSAIYSKRNSLRPRDNNILLLRRSNADRAVDVWLHCAGDEFDNRNDDRIPELPVCLCIRDLDAPAAVAAIEAHPPRALQWCRGTRSISRLVHQDLRAVLEIGKATI